MLWGVGSLFKSLMFFVQGSFTRRCARTKDGSALQRVKGRGRLASEAVTIKVYKESIPRVASRIKELGLVIVRDLLNTLKMAVATDSQRNGMATEKKENLEGMASLHISQRA